MRILLFTGKGGVGTTTLAAATAAALARAGRKALMVSADQAHSLADVLDVRVGAEPSEVDTGLFASRVDTRGCLDGAWEGLRCHLRTVLANAGLDELTADELTVLPGVEELLTLEEIRRRAAGGPWDTVVVDCGPTAEMLRLIMLPEALAGYLERMFPAHRRAVRGALAGLAGAGAAAARWDAAADAISRLAEQLSALRTMLADDATSIRLVLTPERLAVAETRRILTSLALQGVRVDGLVANRVVPAAGAGRGPAARWLRDRRAEQDEMLGELTAGLDLPLRRLGYLASEPAGLPALLRVADALYGADDPLDGPDAAAPWEVRRTAGCGTGTDSEYQLVLRLPGVGCAEVGLARVGDELAVTIDGRRRLIALPPVLCRCAVTGAEVGDDALTVVFRPDPALWMR